MARALAPANAAQTHTKSRHEPGLYCTMNDDKSGPIAVALAIRSVYLWSLSAYRVDSGLGTTYADIISARSCRKNMSDTIPGTMLWSMCQPSPNRLWCTALTSPAADANPERHLAAKSPVNEGSFAVQIRTAKSMSIDVRSDARFPYFVAIGTQNRFPTPSRRKLN
jgi:hypothetical protein